MLLLQVLGFTLYPWCLKTLSLVENFVHFKCFDLKRSNEMVYYKKRSKSQQIVWITVEKGEGHVMRSFRTWLLGFCVPVLTLGFVGPGPGQERQPPPDAPALPPARKR